MALLLPVKQFIRCHHSYIVNCYEVEYVSTRNKMIKLNDGQLIPISYRKYGKFLDSFSKIDF